LFFKGTLFQKWVSVVFAIGLLFYIQANILVWGHGYLDGHTINWNAYLISAIIDSLVWIGIIAISLLKYEKLFKYITISSIFLLVIQAGGLLSLMYLSPPEPQWKSYSFNFTNSTFDFSENENVILIILDTYQSDVFQEIIEENNSYQSYFTGFTYYRNAVGGYPRTIAAIPLILTGKYYKNEEPVDRYIKKVYESSSLLKSLKNEGYIVEIYQNDNIIVPSEDIASNVQPKKIDVQSELNIIYRIDLFRNFPEPLKAGLSPILINVYREFEYDKLFYDEIGHKSKISTTEPVFKFYHLNGPHYPFGLNENVQYQDLPDNRAGFKEQSKASLQIVNRLFQELKNLGIYNNSLIIILGDHGMQDGAYGINTRQLEDQEMLTIVPDKVVSGGIPLVLIKPINSSHPLVISDAPVSLSDIPVTVMTELGISSEFPGISIPDIPISEKRERKFYYYNWDNGAWDNGFLPPMTEYAISDFSWYGSSWRQTFQTFSSKGREIIPPPVYRVNSPINFGNEGNPVPYFISGWSSPEPAYTWTAERTATLAFTMDKPQSDLRMKIELFPFLIPGKLEEQRVIVYVNRQEIGSGTLSSGISEMSFLIPERSFDENIQYISFYLPDARSPDELGVSADRRTIGIGLRSLALEDTNKQMMLSGPATPTETQ
jgi:hypothetical protein